MSERSIQRIHVRADSARQAVQALGDALDVADPVGIFMFVSADYDPEELSAGIRERFACPVLACTTAGEIGDSFSNGGICAIAFDASDFEIHLETFEDLRSRDTSALERRVATIRSSAFYRNAVRLGGGAFACLVVDGLTMMEELVVAEFHRALDGLPLIGGSAGDSLKFQETRVLTRDHGFAPNTAALAIVVSKLPFEAFKLQHFEPSDIDMVVTRSDPRTRIVYEIDGAPAAKEYARLVGLETAELTPMVFSRYPVMLQIGDEWYVRSIQKVNDDGSLTFYCAIDDGLVLTIARGVDFVDTLGQRVKDLESRFSRIHATIGFDCILRRLEMIECGTCDDVNALTQRIGLTGFSTFGEQYNSIHVNQTLTGVCIGVR